LPSAVELLKLAVLNSAKRTGAILAPNQSRQSVAYRKAASVPSLH
jgi:hypothetical protein